MAAVPLVAESQREQRTRHGRLGRYRRRHLPDAGRTRRHGCCCTISPTAPPPRPRAANCRAAVTRCIQADLSDPPAIERLWREAAAAAPIEALVNNAGIFPAHAPLTTAYAEWTAAWQRTLAINLLGPAHLSYCAARAMAERGRGRIVNVSVARGVPRRAERARLRRQQGRD